MKSRGPEMSEMSGFDAGERPTVDPTGSTEGTKGQEDFNSRSVLILICAFVFIVLALAASFLAFSKSVETPVQSEEQTPLYIDRHNARPPASEPSFEEPPEDANAMEVRTNPTPPPPTTTTKKVLEYAPFLCTLSDDVDTTVFVFPPDGLCEVIYFDAIYLYFKNVVGAPMTKNLIDFLDYSKAHTNRTQYGIGISFLNFTVMNDLWLAKSDVLFRYLDYIEDHKANNYAMLDVQGRLYRDFGVCFYLIEEFQEYHESKGQRVGFNLVASIYNNSTLHGAYLGASHSHKVLDVLNQPPLRHLRYYVFLTHYPTSDYVDGDICFIKTPQVFFQPTKIYANIRFPGWKYHCNMDIATGMRVAKRDGKLYLQAIYKEIRLQARWQNNNTSATPIVVFTVFMPHSSMLGRMRTSVRGNSANKERKRDTSVTIEKLRRSPESNSNKKVANDYAFSQHLLLLEKLDAYDYEHFMRANYPFLDKYPRAITFTLKPYNQKPRYPDNNEPSIGNYSWNNECALHPLPPNKKYEYPPGWKGFATLGEICRDQVYFNNIDCKPKDVEDGCITFNKQREMIVVWDGPNSTRTKICASRRNLTFLYGVMAYGIDYDDWNYECPQLSPYGPYSRLRLLYKLNDYLRGYFYNDDDFPGCMKVEPDFVSLEDFRKIKTWPEGGV